MDAQPTLGSIHVSDTEIRTYIKMIASLMKKLNKKGDQ